MAVHVAEAKPEQIELTNPRHLPDWREDPKGATLPTPRKRGSSFVDHNKRRFPSPSSTGTAGTLAAQDVASMLKDATTTGLIVGTATNEGRTAADASDVRRDWIKNVGPARDEDAIVAEFRSQKDENARRGMGLTAPPPGPARTITLKVPVSMIGGKAPPFVAPGSESMVIRDAIRSPHGTAVALLKTQHVEPEITGAKWFRDATAAKLKERDSK